MKHKIDKTAQSLLCRMCDKKSETMSHLMSECFEGVLENEEVKIFWDVMIQCDREIKARKPDAIVVNKNERSCAIIDIAIHGDIRL